MQITLPSGETVQSDEEPGCTDHQAFAEQIRTAKAAFPVVIVEGYVLLHSPEVRELLTHVWLLEMSPEQCIARRSAPRGVLNPNPITADKCQRLVWPAYERYLV